MTNQRIFYNRPDGKLSIVCPSEEALLEHTIEEIAEKDVPSGLAYRIGTLDDFPNERDFRNAWEISDDELTDGVGGEYTVFRTDPTHPDYVEPSGE